MKSGSFRISTLCTNTDIDICTKCRLPFSLADQGITTRKTGILEENRIGRYMRLTVILIRLVIVYVLLTMTVRFMGKRQIGEMQMSELVVAFMLSELATMPITDTTVPLLYSVLPILLLAIMEILTSFAFLHSPTLSRIVTGTPQIVIRYGTINRKVLKNCRMTLSELMGELRLKGYPDPADIAYAILEENGRLSVIPRASAQPPRADELSMQVRESGISHTVIADGIISETGMKLASVSEGQVYAYLKKRKTEPNDVFLLTVNNVGEWNLITIGESERTQ